MKVATQILYAPDYSIHHKIVREEHEIEIDLNITVDGEPFSWVKHSQFLSSLTMETPENASKDKKLTQKEKTIQTISMAELWCMLKRLSLHKEKE